MKHKVAELEGALLDAAVAKAEGARLMPGWIDWPETHERAGWHLPTRWAPSFAWEDGGPIIERERIELAHLGGWENPWQSQCSGFVEGQDDAIWHGIGPTPLIAAMRAYVSSKLGEEVELP